MNKQTAKEYLPLVQAMADGKVIEMCDDKYENWITLSELNFTGPSSQYRIKQSPSLRPWKPEEVPVGVLIRIKNCPNPHNHDVEIILGRSSENNIAHIYTAFLLNRQAYPYLEDREYSTNGGKTWLPCGVPIE